MIKKFLLILILNNEGYAQVIDNQLVLLSKFFFLVLETFGLIRALVVLDITGYIIYNKIY